METFFERWNLYLGRTFWYAPSFYLASIFANRINRMKKIITYILIALLAFSLSANNVQAQVQTGSATIKANGSVPGGFDYRVQNLQNFLEKYDSPLAPYAADFVAYADTYGLDYRLVPSISGVESTFGKNIPSKSYNAYGWVNGDYSFKSWPDSISVVSQTLKLKYVDKGAVSIQKIARRYAPPSKTWGSKVTYFEGKIDTLPLTFDLSS